MGLNTTVVIMNDALGCLEHDSGYNLSQVIQKPNPGPESVASINHLHAAAVLEAHHSSSVWVGGNLGIVQDVLVPCDIMKCEGFEAGPTALSSVSKTIRYHLLAMLKTEIEKCEVRCANCHRRKTARDLGWRQNWAGS